MIKAVLFDLDGTLGDTLPLCVEAFRKSITPISGKVFSREEIIATFGPSEEATVRQLIPKHFDAGIHAYWEWYAKLHSMCPTPFPGIREILDLLRARGVALGLVTGKAEKSAAISLKAFALRDYFSAFEYGHPDRSRKDEGIANILRQFSLRPEEAAYVGDAPSDIHFARKAGVAMYAAAWAATSDYTALKALGPDEIFRTVEEFAAYADRRIMNADDKSALH